MNWIFDNDRPIYIQLVEQLKIFIVSGLYKPGGKLPSVRDLALITKVNPNTMQKALVELELYGIINTKRTSGRFVTEDLKLLEKIRNEMAKEKVNSFFDNMKKLGFCDKEVIEYLKNERNV